MKNHLNEELERMLYLSGHKRGVVISEQSKIDEQLLKKLKNWFKKRKQRKGNLDPKKNKNTSTEIPDWEGKKSGTLDFDFFKQHLALNVAGDFNLNITHIDPKPIEKLPPEKRDKIFDPFELRGKDMPFHDNMINPDFKDAKYKDALTKYNYFISQIAQYLTSGGVNKEGKSAFDSIRKITITGEADAAPPTRKSPTGNLSDLINDHKTVGCNELFCGSTDKATMNIWLATNRAIRFGNRVTEDVKNLTGVDISSKIVYGTPISHYNASYEPGDKEYDTYRGEQFRSVSLVPDADVIEVEVPSPAEEDSADPAKEGEQYYKITDTIKLPLLPKKVRGGYKYVVRPDLVEKYNLTEILNFRGDGSFNGSETPTGTIKLGDSGEPGDVDNVKIPQSITIGKKEFKFNSSDSKDNPDYAQDSYTTPYRTDAFPMLEYVVSEYQFSLGQFTLTRSY